MLKGKRFMVALTALVLGAAVAGSAIAGPDASTSRLDKKEKKQTKKLAKKQINKKLPIEEKNLADGAVTTPKIGDGAVTTNKLSSLERSEGYLGEGTGAPELTTTVSASLATGTTIATKTVPAGSYLVTAKSNFAKTSADAIVKCGLFDDGTQLDASGQGTNQSSLGFANLALIGASDGGTLTVRCRANATDVTPDQAKIGAVKVASIG